MNLIEAMEFDMRKYSRPEILAFIASVHDKVGDVPFTSLRLMALETLVRTHDKLRALPGKTVLREALNEYRTKRWPSLAPKPVMRRY